MHYRRIFFLFFIFSFHLLSAESVNDGPMKNPLAIWNDYLTGIERDKRSRETPQDHDFDHYIPSLSAESEPIATVENCINVLSGQFFQVDVDLASHAIDPINLVRYYDSENKAESFIGYGFGTVFPLWATGRQEGARHEYGLVSEREHRFLLYQRRKNDRTATCTVDSRLFERGCTNLSRAKLSGKSNLINWKAVFRSKSPSSRGWIVQAGDGSRREYSKPVKLNPFFADRIDLPDTHAYRQVGHLTLFTHRFYHSHLMRWLTTDPLGYSEGLNLYCYVRNNPFDYRDPDGRFVVAIPIFSVAFGAATSVAFFPAFATAVVAAAATYGVYKAGEYVGGMINDYRMHKDDVEEAEENRVDEKGEYKKKQPPRTEPRNLEEQLTLDEARANPGKDIPKDKLNIKDPRYPANDWQKKTYEHERLDGSKTNQIHYWENLHTGERHGFKFKDTPN